MSISACLIFPHQLFKTHPALAAQQKVYLIEDHLFFNQYRFHQQKIVLHRASMRYYEDYLKKLDFDVEYIEQNSSLSNLNNLLLHIKKEGVQTVFLCDVADDWLEQNLTKACTKAGVQIQWKDSPAFLINREEIDAFFENRKRYFQTDFYIHHRKKNKILLDEQGKALGGKWTYDGDNRKKLPKNTGVPPVKNLKENKWVKAAKGYVNEYYSENYGELVDFNYACTFEEAEDLLEDFLQQRFSLFGDYEDAIEPQHNHLFHSVLSPYLNIGLLTPQQVLDRAMDYADKNNTPLNSLEGFVRQIMGWREFIRAVYYREGRKERSTNYWGFNRKIPKCFYEGTTGITPVDDTIKKVLKTAYNHHIERLMILGNFMLLCEFDPDEVYQWFMEMYIDAYDWVMVPNVYGMTQFADGGLMTSKPYISGSNYIIKMSSYKKSEKWTPIWDALFWRFMHEHRNFFEQNPRLGMLLKTLDKQSVEKREGHLKTAREFLSHLDKLD